jgi:hypothetical protein
LQRLQQQCAERNHSRVCSFGNEEVQALDVGPNSKLEQGHLCGVRMKTDLTPGTSLTHLSENSKT